MRKTFSIQKFKDFINTQLASDRITEIEKTAFCSAIERVLMDADCYNGFQYNYWMKQGCNEWHAAGEPDEKDIYMYGPNCERYSRKYY